MRHYITTTIALLCLLLLIPCHILAAGDKKKGKKVKDESTLIFNLEPDARVAPQKPQHILRPVQELGSVESLMAGIVSHKGSYGPHTAHSRGGIDVSHYQGAIDWKSVARSGTVLYAFCKATENISYVDDTYHHNVREARRHGIPVGCYHFFNPHSPGAVQFEHFKRTVDMKQLDVVPMLDVEVRGKASLKAFQDNVRSWLKAFEQTYHFKPMIYASLNFYNKYLAGAFDDYLYMIAKYGGDTPNPEGPIPFALWQFTASGRVSGIRGDVDKSCFIDHFDVKDILIKNQRTLK